MQIVVKAAQFLNFVHLMLFKLTFRCNTCQTLSFFKGALSDLRQFLATESPLKMMKNAFYFTLKAFFLLKKFKFLSVLTSWSSRKTA